MSLTPEQVQELLKPIDPSRVSKDGKGYSHLEIWDVRRTMNQIFGFAQWSGRTDVMEFVSGQQVKGKDGKERWNVFYRARCTIEIGDYMTGGATYTEWAVGEATNPSLAEAHDLAIKTAESQAFKRCAVNLGDQFGLSLYKNGSTEAVVGEIVGQEHQDSVKVEVWLLALLNAESEEDLMAVASEIRGADISTKERALLTTGYKNAQVRIKAL
jgi:recombination DNA repair RAD52 pathway protein